MLYMLFNVSCNHSLKESQMENKDSGNKRKSCSLVFSNYKSTQKDITLTKVYGVVFFQQVNTIFSANKPHEKNCV